MFHYTYNIHNESTGQYYIGLRSSKLEPNEDPYMGSGTWLKAEMRKLPTGWNKYVLGIHPNRKDAAEDEKNSTKGHLNNGLCLNLVQGGSTNRMAGGIHSPEHKAKLKIAAQRRVKEKPATAETIAKIVLKNTGKKRTEETRHRMSCSLKGKNQRPKTNEEKLHLSLVTKGKKKSPEHIANVVAAKKRNKELRLAQLYTK